MRSPLRYPGGKTKKSIQKKILSYLPANFSEYREPFVGGGGIYFAIPTNITNKRWINDINSGLVSFYDAMISRPNEFIAQCKEIEPAKEGEPLVLSREGSSPNSKKYNARLKAKFDELKYNEECDQALRYFFINRTVWAGRVNYNPDMESRMYFSNPQGWNIVNTNRLEEVSEWMQGTRVTCGSYKKLLEETGEDVVIYCDPPYIVDTNLDRMSQLYEFGFSIEDHEEFADTVSKCSHKVCISYDDTKEIRSLYQGLKGFYINEETWKYCGTANKQKKEGKELVITNYQIEPRNSLLGQMDFNDVVFEE